VLALKILTGKKKEDSSSERSSIAIERRSSILKPLRSTIKYQE
jgi:hypothetical protein